MFGYVNKYNENQMIEFEIAGDFLNDFVAVNDKIFRFSLDGIPDYRIN